MTETIIVPMTLVTAAQASGTLLQMKTTGPIYRGKGRFRYLCGHCHTVMLDAVDFRRVLNTVFVCRCGRFNQLPHVEARAPVTAFDAAAGDDSELSVTGLSEVP